MPKSYYYDESTDKWVPLVQGYPGPAGPPVEGIDDVPGLRDALDGKADGTVASLTITEDHLLNGWTAVGSSLLTREGSMVMLAVRSGGINGENATADRFLDLPPGFRIDIPGNYADLGYLASAGGPVAVRKDVTHLASSARVRLTGGVLVWTTADPMPTP